MPPLDAALKAKLAVSEKSAPAKAAKKKKKKSNISRTASSSENLEDAAENKTPPPKAKIVKGKSKGKNSKSSSHDNLAAAAKKDGGSPPKPNLLPKAKDSPVGERVKSGVKNQHLMPSCINIPLYTRHSYFYNQDLPLATTTLPTFTYEYGVVTPKMLSRDVAAVAELTPEVSTTSKHSTTA